MSEIVKELSGRIALSVYHDLQLFDQHRGSLSYVEEVDVLREIKGIRPGHALLCRVVISLDEKHFDLVAGQFLHLFAEEERSVEALALVIIEVAREQNEGNVLSYGGLNERSKGLSCCGLKELGGSAVVGFEIAQLAV